MLVCQTCKRSCEDHETACPVDGSELLPAGAGRALDATLPLTDATAAGPARMAPARDADLPPGTMVGEYAVTERIGVGGMGVVYSARHPVIGKRAAVKVLNARYSADQHAVERFVLEAQAVNQIGHANIVDVFSFGVLPDGRSYSVMELLRGETLGARLARGDLSFAERLEVLEGIAEPLEAAHDAGVIHRDLKPDNVFLVKSTGDTFRVKLLDFGIAKLSDAVRPSTTRTQTGAVVGTPLYMSPEQAKGTPVDVRTDIYAFGALAFEMLVGRPPFQDGSSVEILAAHINEPPPLPRSIWPEFPASLESLLLDLLAKSPDERPALSEARRRLAAISAVATTGVVWLAPPVAVASDPATIPAVSRSRRRWVAAAAAAVIAGAIVGIAVAAGRRDDPPARPLSASAAPAIVAPVQVAADPVGAAAPAIVGAAAPAIVGAAAPAIVGAAAPAIVAPPPVPVPALPADGRLALVVDPATARVTIDGVRVQVNRGRVEAVLAAGDHALVVAAPGRLGVRRKVTILAAEAVDLTIRLLPRPSDPTVVGDGVLDPFAP